MGKGSMRKVLAIGNIGIVVILVFTAFPSIVHAQSVKSNELKSNIFQQIKDKFENKDWAPGDFIMAIILLIIIGWLEGNIFY